MFTLRGVFPPPPKDPKKNFIKENVKQLKLMQSNRVSEECKHNSRRERRCCVPLSASSNFSVKCSKGHMQAESACFKQPSIKSGQFQEAVRLRKADMAEFLRRKSVRESRAAGTPPSMKEENHAKFTEEEVKPISTLRDVGCQYIDPDATHLFADGGKLRVIYPSKKVLEQIEHDFAVIEQEELKKNPTASCRKMSAGRCGSMKVVASRYLSTGNLNEAGGNTSIRSKCSLPSPGKHDDSGHNVADEKPNPLRPPPSYQKGVVPKYLKKKKEFPQEEKSEPFKAEPERDEPPCPPGHIALPESERIETLKILKDKFIELVSELNKIPVRTDTLRMKNRKMQLDKEFTKLEEGIKVFSRKHVFVKIEV